MIQILAKANHFGNQYFLKSAETAPPKSVKSAIVDNPAKTYR